MCRTVWVRGRLLFLAVIWPTFWPTLLRFSDHQTFLERQQCPIVDYIATTCCYYSTGLWLLADDVVNRDVTANRPIFAALRAMMCGCVELESPRSSDADIFLPERDYVTFGSLLSQFRLSVVCLSVVCNVGAPYSEGWSFQQNFFTAVYAGHPLTSMQNFTEIVLGETLRRER